jgi:Fe-S-cluster-containing dehydrogenase component
MKLTRRTFFKVGAVGATTLAGATRTAEAGTVSGPDPAAKGVLVDTTRCIGCRACEAACAEANHLGEPALSGDDRIFETRRVTDQRTLTVVNRFDTTNPDHVAQFIKTQCMHCVDPACATACPARALEKTALGPVTYTGNRCLGCRYCMVSCPFDVPKFEYEKAVPYVRKCSFCAERQAEGLAPACTEVCPSGALTFGLRAELIEEANLRIYQNPDAYEHHIYGEHEAGGTSWLYITDVESSQLGLKPGLDNIARPKLASTALGAVPMIMTLWPPVLMGLYALRNRTSADTTENSHE